MFCAVVRSTAPPPAPSCNAAQSVLDGVHPSRFSTFQRLRYIAQRTATGGKCQRPDRFTDMAHSGEHTQKEIKDDVPPHRPHHHHQAPPLAYRSASPADLTKCPHCATLTRY